MYLTTAGSLIKQVDGGFYCPNPMCDAKIAHAFESNSCGRCESSNYLNTVCKVDLSKIKATLSKIDLPSRMSKGRLSAKSSKYGANSVQLDDNVSVGASSINQSQGGPSQH